jgi:hypothetical protein
MLGLGSEAESSRGFWDVFPELSGARSLAGPSGMLGAFVENKNRR